MKSDTSDLNKNFERRIRKHIHAQPQTVECHVPPGFAELGVRTTKEYLGEFENTDSKITIQSKGSRIRIENLPFDAIHSLLLKGLIFTEIKLRIFRSRCSTEQKLLQILSEIDWDLWLPTSALDDLDVRVDSQASQLYHEARIKRLVLEFFAKRHKSSKLKSKKSAEAFSIALDFQLDKEALEIFISMSGRDFWKRGHKQSLQHAAPLREDIAACLVQRVFEISRDHSQSIRPTHVFNPFCGTGTLLHEAALFTSGYAHILTDTSQWLYQRLPFYKDKAFSHARKKLIENVNTKTQKDHDHSIAYIGEDIEQRLCDATKIWFQQSQRDFNLMASAETFLVDSCLENIKLPKLSKNDSIWIFANPPFGLRLSTESQGGNDKLYAAFAKRLINLIQLLSRNSASATGVLLCPSEKTWRIVLKEFSHVRHWSEHFSLGGLDIRAFYFTTASV